jgi:hypothetical protein
MFTGCSLDVHWMFTGCSLDLQAAACRSGGGSGGAEGVPWMFAGCVLNVHWMFTGCSLDVHWMFTGCSLDVHWISRLQLAKAVVALAGR